MINILLFPTLMKFLTRSEFEFTKKLNLILFVICSYVTTTATATATVTNRSIILYKEQCLCSNYVLRKKLSIVDCFWF